MTLRIPFVKSQLHESVYKEVSEELEILDATQGQFDLKQVLTGKQTPVFFGSATNNFGVELLLRGFPGIPLNGTRPSSGISLKR